MFDFLETYLKCLAMLFTAALLILSAAIPVQIVSEKYGEYWGMVTAFLVLVLWIACAAFI